MNQFEYEKNLIKSTLDECVYAALQDCDAVLAGGALTSIFSGKEINDFDLYFKNKIGFTRFLVAAYGQSYDDLSINEARVAHHTSRSILVNSYGNHLQLIGMRLFETVQDIFDSFDFTINMAAYDFKTEEFILHHDFLKDLACRRLVVNTNTAYPLVSVLRVDKYRERGYSISKVQMLRLLLAVNKKNLDSWEAVVDEVGGLYGIRPEDIFDTTKEFSLDEAMEQLSKTFLPEKYTELNANVDLDKLLESFQDIVDEDILKKVKEKPYNNFFEFL